MERYGQVIGRASVPIDAGRHIHIGRQIFDTLLEVASRRRTCAERLGHKEFVPWRIGPVM